MRNLSAKGIFVLVSLAGRGGRVESVQDWGEICDCCGFKRPDALVQGQSGGTGYVSETRVDLPDGGMDVAYTLLPRGWAIVDAARIKARDGGG